MEKEKKKKLKILNLKIYLKMKKLQKIGELLQFDADAAAYLMAEFRLKRMVGDVYKILADAVDIDLGLLES